MIITYVDGREVEINDRSGVNILEEIYGIITATSPPVYPDEKIPRKELSDILQTISDYLQPEDVFDPERLDDLARSRGFVEGPDFD